MPAPLRSGRNPTKVGPSALSQVSYPLEETIAMHSPQGSRDGLFRSRIEKDGLQQIEIISVPYVLENPKYQHEGLRIDGDGLDHTKFNPSNFPFIMVTAGCAMALCGSQIVPLLYLTVGSRIAHDLNHGDLLVWLLSAIIVSQGIFAPFVGPLADLFGRKTFLLAALVANIVGAIVCSTTHNIGGFLAGQVLLGFGTVNEELLAIAVVGESVPTAQRPLYGALILCAIIPWSPGTMYANWITASSWRWIGCALAVWNGINMVIIAIWYKPPPRINARGLTKSEKFRRIDFTGGILVTMGLLFLLIGLNWGGNTYPWNSAHVVSFLTLSGLIFVTLVIWELKFVRYPLFPRRMIFAPKPFFCLMLVIFAAGVNYMPLVVFWPIQTISVFNAGRFEVGLYTVPIGIGILSGAILSALLLGIFKNHVILTMFFFCVVQTVASACLKLIDRNNLNTAWAPIVLALIGVGGVLVPNQVIITIITPDDLIASVTALTVGLRSQAQVIGLSLFYNRFYNEVTKNTWKYVVPVMITDIQYVNEAQIRDMMWTLVAVPFKEYVATIPQIANSPNLEKLRVATINAYADSYERVYLITIAFGVAACIAAALMGNISQYMDNHVAVVYEEARTQD